MATPLEDQAPGFLTIALGLTVAGVIGLAVWALPWLVIITGAVLIWRCSE